MIGRVVSFPRGIVLLTIGISLLAAAGLRRGLTLDASPQSFIENGGQALDDFRSAAKIFGPDDYLIATVTADDIFRTENLERLRRLQQQISAIDGVGEVLSLANVPYARSLPDGASLEMLLPSQLSDAARVAEARAAGTSDRLYEGNVISRDGRTAAINILFEASLPTPQRHIAVRQIYDLVRNAGFERSFFAGDPFTQWRAVEAIRRDLRTFLPLTLLLIAALLWLSFRSLAAVLMPLLTIGIGLLWLLGLMGWLQAHFTILALMLPTLMLAIGCSYMIHVVNQIGLTAEARGDGADRLEVIVEATQFIALPVIVSALTIMAGFLSLSFTKIPSVRATSIHAAAGAGITMLLSLTFLPAMLALFPGSARRAISFRSGMTGRIVGLLVDVGNWATTRQPLLYVATGLVVLLSLLGMHRIRIDIDFFNFFKPGSETSIGLSEINRRLSGAVTFNLIIDGQGPEAIVAPDVLRRMAELQRSIESYRDPDGRGIDRTLSVADFLSHANRAFNGGTNGVTSIPEDRAVVEELLADREQLRSFLSSDGRVARLLIRSNLSGSQSMDQAITEMERRGREAFPDFRVYTTGTLVLLNQTSDRIAGEQRLSVTIALATIFVMLSILFRSMRVGLTALVPNLIPILFFFGFMGWMGIPLNLTTSLVASVVLGLAVDNAVQFIVRFRRLQQLENADADLRATIIESMRLSGRPIIYANVALAATFAIFSVSTFEPISSFGLLSAVTILGCLLEDLVLLPARLTSPVFKAH